MRRLTLHSDFWRSGVGRQTDGSGFQWRLPVLLGATYAFAFVDRTVMAVAGAPIEHDLALSDSQFGLLSGPAFAVLFCLFSVPLGGLADRLDRRPMIICAIALWSVMTALGGLAHSFWVLAVARIGVGLGEACLLPVGMSLLRSRMPPSQMGRAVATFLIGATIGAAMIHLAGGYLLVRLQGRAFVSLPLLGPLVPWRVLFVLAALPGIVIAACFAAVREPSRWRVERPPRQLRAAMLQIWAGRRAYGLLTAATACTVTLTQAPAAWLPIYYVRSFGLSPGKSAIEVGIMLLVGAPLGQWVGGLLIDQFRAWAVPAPHNTVLAVGAVLSVGPAIVFCTAGSLRVSEVSYVLFSLLASAATPSGLAGWQALTPAPCVGLVVAILVSLVTLIGVGVGPLAIGFLTDHLFRNKDALGLAMLASIVSAGLLGGLFAMLGGRAFRICAARQVASDSA